MYSAGVVMMVGIPLALGSYWALLVTAAALVLLVIRTLDEEKMLRAELARLPRLHAAGALPIAPLAW